MVTKEVYGIKSLGSLVLNLQFIAEDDYTPRNIYMT